MWEGWAQMWPNNPLPPLRWDRVKRLNPHNLKAKQPEIIALEFAAIFVVISCIDNSKPL